MLEPDGVVQHARHGGTQKVAERKEGGEETGHHGLGWKLLSRSQCQELGQRANLAFDWLPENKEPIRSQFSSLTQLLTRLQLKSFRPRA